MSKTIGRVRINVTTRYRLEDGTRKIYPEGMDVCHPYIPQTMIDECNRKNSELITVLGYITEDGNIEDIEEKKNEIIEKTQELETASEDLKKRELELEQRTKSLDERETDIDNAVQELDKREEGLVEREKNLAAKLKEIPSGSQKSQEKKSRKGQH